MEIAIEKKLTILIRNRNIEIYYQKFIKFTLRKLGIKENRNFRIIW